MWQEWLELQYDLIREGKVVLCSGETGSQYPAFADAEIAHTDWSAAEIILHRIAREG